MEATHLKLADILLPSGQGKQDEEDVDPTSG
jgi:hypothetical protein